jgi:hypothetical protein
VGIPAGVTVRVVSARVGVLGLVLGLYGLLGCGTVDPGQDIQFAQVIFDQNFFYCEVEPMIFAEGCGPGKSGTDPAAGCHFSIATFPLADHEPIPCTNGEPDPRKVSTDAANNYQAASLKMSPDPALSQLLRRPTKQAAHPRQIFDAKSPQADLIREWGTKYTSQ